MIYPKKCVSLFAKLISCFQNLMYRFLRDLCPPRRGSPQVLITSRPPTPSHVQKVDVYNMSDITRLFRKMINKVSKNKKWFGTESRFVRFLEANRAIRANRANQANRANRANRQPGQPSQPSQPGQPSQPSQPGQPNKRPTKYNRANRANRANREHAKLQFRMCR